MRFLVETASGLIHTIRLATGGQWFLRLLAVASLLGSAQLCQWWFPVLAQPVLLAVVLGAALWTTAQPESWAPLVGIGTVVLWWLVGADGPRWWQTVTLATVLAVFHIAVAYCASAPSYTTIRGAGVRAWLSRGAGYLATCVLGMGLVLAVAAIPADVVPRGLLWVVLGLAAVAGAAVLVVARLRAG